MKRGTALKIKNEALRMFLATSSLILTAMLVNPASGDLSLNGSSGNTASMTQEEQQDQEASVKLAREQSQQNLIEKKLGLQKHRTLRKVAKLR